MIVYFGDPSRTRTYNPRNVATKSWPGRVEILSAYLGSFGAGGVWPVIVFAAEKPACHAGDRGFEPRLSCALMIKVRPPRVRECCLCREQPFAERVEVAAAKP